jgi:hypothetical protein
VDNDIEFGINATFEQYMHSPKALRYLCTEYGLHSIDHFNMEHIRQADRLQLLDAVKGSLREPEKYKKIDTGYSQILYVRNEVYSSAIQKAANISTPERKHHHSMLLYADVAIDPTANTIVKCRHSVEKLIDKALFIG